VGCAAPEPSYSALDDDAMMKLFPTATEIKTALGDINTVTGPKAQLPKPNVTPPANDGISQECYDAAYGNFGPNVQAPTRMFAMQSSGSGGPSFVWVLTQRASAEEIRKGQDELKGRLGKCDRYESFDAGTTSGTSFVTKPSADGKGPREGVNVVMTSGDVSMAFAVYGVPYEQGKDLAMKMAPVMEKRLKASAPKS
jgi:hypothetical protein